MSSQHYDALARAVRDRRRELDLTQLQLAERGGPSDTKVSQIEAGKPQAISPATFRKLDAALGWWPGSARWVLSNGEAPTSPPQSERMRVDIANANLGVTVEEALAQATPEQLAAELLRRTTGRAPGLQASYDELDAAGEESQDDDREGGYR